MHKISSTRKIPTSYKKLQDVIWDINKWSAFWSPLKEVEILYDDGLSQEFNIFVSWEGEVVPVRTIRFKEECGNIAFFSPVPPPPTTIHHGFWCFKLLDDGCVELSAIRHFCYPSENIGAFAARFQERLNSLLIKIEELCQK